MIYIYYIVVLVIEFMELQARVVVFFFMTSYFSNYFFAFQLTSIRRGKRLDLREKIRYVVHVPHASAHVIGGVLLRIEMGYISQRRGRRWVRDEQWRAKSKY